MKVTFLGTGTSQGVPVIACDCEVCRSLDFRDKRLRSSVLVDTGTLSLVIDTGPDFRQQMLREKVQRIDAVLYTHEHKDHVAGMDDIRSFNFKQQMDIPVYAQDRVIRRLEQEFAYVFAKDRYPGAPKVDVHAIERQSFCIGPQAVVPIMVWHNKLSVLGFRIDDFTYITDAKTIEEEEKQKIRGSEVLVINALQRSADPHHAHLTLEEAVPLAQELGARQTYFTHIGHRMGLHQQVSDMLPEGIALAYDGLSITL